MVLTFNSHLLFSNKIKVRMQIKNPIISRKLSQESQTKIKLEVNHVPQRKMMNDTQQ